MRGFPYGAEGGGRGLARRRHAMPGAVNGQLSRCTCQTSVLAAICPELCSDGGRRSPTRNEGPRGQSSSFISARSPRHVRSSTRCRVTLAPAEGQASRRSRRCSRKSGRPRRGAKVQRARPSSARTAISPIPIAWTLGKTPRLGRTRSSTSTGPLLVAILSAIERLRIARCEIYRPSRAGCSARAAASRTSRPSSGSNAAPGARRYFRSGKRSSHWSVWPFCARSSSSGPARSDHQGLPAVTRLAAPVSAP